MSRLFNILFAVTLLALAPVAAHAADDKEVEKAPAAITTTTAQAEIKTDEAAAKEEAPAPKRTQAELAKARIEANKKRDAAKAKRLQAMQAISKSSSAKAPASK